MMIANHAMTTMTAAREAVCGGRVGCVPMCVGWGGAGVKVQRSPCVACVVSLCVHKCRSPTHMDRRKC